MDTTAADVLFDLDRLLDERGQTLVFAELKDPVRRKIERYGLAREIEPQHFFPTVEAAVEAWCAKTGATWAEAVPPGPADRRRAAAEAGVTRHVVGAPEW